MEYELWPKGERLPKGHQADIPGHYRNARSPEGYYRSLTHSSWYNMIIRCYAESQQARPQSNKYKRDGILVYCRWVFGDGTKCGFLCFLEDMGERPSRAHTISRMGDLGNYIPGNIKWEIQVRKKKVA